MFYFTNEGDLSVCCKMKFRKQAVLQTKIVFGRLFMFRTCELRNSCLFLDRFIQTNSVFFAQINHSRITKVYDYFVLCKMYWIISERKHEHLTLKIDNQVIAHGHETRSGVNNKLVLPRYTKSKCQNALIFRGIKLWNTTPNDIKQSANLARFKKYLKRYLLNSSENPDI